MTGAADELALAAASVIARLEMRGEQFPILLAGGMLRESAWLAAEVARADGRSGAAQHGAAARPTNPRSAPCGWRSRKPAAACACRRTSMHVRSSTHAVNIQRFDDEQALAAALATRVLDAHRRAADARARACRPAARRLALYRELRERTRRSDRLVAACAPSISTSSSASTPSHPGSYRAFMQAELFDHVSIDPANIGFLDGRAADLKAECRRYEDAIAAAGGIDLQILGIGANGHIGFNEPADGLCATTHIADLEEETPRRPTRSGSAATGPPCRSARCRWGWRRFSARGRSC